MATTKVPTGKLPRLPQRLGGLPVNRVLKNGITTRAGIQCSYKNEERSWTIAKIISLSSSAQVGNPRKAKLEEGQLIAAILSLYVSQHPVLPPHLSDSIFILLGGGQICKTQSFGYLTVN